jgi:hypothetical protein
MRDMVLRRTVCYIVNAYVFPDPAIYPLKLLQIAERKSKQSGPIVYRKNIFQKTIRVKLILDYLSCSCF